MSGVDYSSVVERIKEVTGISPHLGDRERARWKAGSKSIVIWDDGSKEAMCRYVGLSLIEVHPLSMRVAKRWAKWLVMEDRT